MLLIMALMRSKWNPCEYEIKRDEGEVRLIIHCENCVRSPSVEDDPVCMSKAIEYLGQVKDATSLIFQQKRVYEYDYFETKLLKEIAEVYNKIIKSGVLIKYNVEEKYTRFYDEIYTKIANLIYGNLKSDPIQTYFSFEKLKKRLRVVYSQSNDEKLQEIVKKYISNIDKILEILEGTKLITMAKPYINEETSKNRSIYRSFIFFPTIRPNFMYTKLLASYPINGIEMDSYNLNGAEITIFSFPDSVKYMYHIVPPEFKLSEEEYELLELAREIMAQHQPEKSEFVDPLRMREVFYNIGKELLSELAVHKNISLNEEKIDQLAQILVRYAVGFGLIELILSDPKVQDVNVNSPAGETPVFLVHESFDDCEVNIFPTKEDFDSWATKLRLLSGRPFDEANQLLDTELLLPGASVRVSAITRPLNPYGYGFSFRRHRDRPWTLPLLMKYKSINANAAGLLSFLIDGTRSFLIAGTRGSGKTSFMSALMVEIMRRYRVITVEDTLELPVEHFRKLGYNIQPMKVASALSLASNEMPADLGIRATLRLGDSALIIGEVRSKEAIALYEAMRVGAAANVVAGTIHADSPYGVYDRVVMDIGINPTSFKATDIIVIIKPLKSPDGLRKIRRVVQITEVRKTWQKDPLEEHGFVDLMIYNPQKDELEFTDDFLHGDSEIIKAVASQYADFVGNWDLVVENIELRAKVKQHILNMSVLLNEPLLLEAPFVILGNDLMHLSIQEVKEQIGYIDHKKVYDLWLEKFKTQVLDRLDILKKQYFENE
ncbi:MAG: type II/IV secretion system ATPase subunit [Candidatus Woesearchaeota archaeon]